MASHHTNQSRSIRSYATLKRTVDIAAALFLLIVLSPLLLFCAIGVRLSSPGPIIFRQKRVGYHNQTFDMYKFRSMYLNIEQATRWSTDYDERKTPFGALLRKLSLDELPQLVNVLKGDMSLVGPRPEIPFFVDQFQKNVPSYLDRHQIRPGITGWAQIHGFRGDTSVEDRTRYDLYYLENQSFLLDLKILLITILGGKFINSEQL